MQLCLTVSENPLIRSTIMNINDLVQLGSNVCNLAIRSVLILAPRSKAVDRMLSRMIYHGDQISPVVPTQPLNSLGHYMALIASE